MERIEKPWGAEELLEHNEFYVVKRLFMKQGACCSLQYHEFKHETIYVLNGVLTIVQGDSEDSLEEVKLAAGSYLAIPPGKIHRMIGFTDCTYLESSTTQLDDVVRVQDEYGRV